MRALPQRPLVVSMQGFEPAGVSVDRMFRVEQLGTLLSDLQDGGVTQVCFAGAILRPQIDPQKIDANTLPLVPKMMGALQGGDDAALRAVISIFEEAGLDVVAPHELATDLLPKPGIYTSASPQSNHESDAERAASIIRTIGDLDVGQCCAVKAGQAIAIEGVFGTDWLLESLQKRPDGSGGIFYKAKKPSQDERIDLPTIGVQTIVGVSEAKLDGVIIQAQEVIVLDKQAVIDACNDKGLFLWVRE